MSQQSIGAKPTGVIGKIAGRIMNSIHSKQYKDIINHIADSLDDKTASILDIGCGGGIALFHFYKTFKAARIYGIDLSPDMVSLSKKLNRKGIAEGGISVFCADVCDIPIQGKTVGILSAFDCINFWNDYPAAFSEMRRILLPNGKIFIINGYPEPDTKWYEFVRFKSIDAYRNLLESNGFRMTNAKTVKHTVILEGVAACIPANA